MSARISRGPMAADVLQRDFTQIHNRLFRDPRLSFKAKGIFGLISTHRDGYGVSAEWIAAASTDGLSAVKTGLRELERYGYLVREQERKSDGTRGQMTYSITDMPSSVPPIENRLPVMTCDDAETPSSEPSVENPSTAEPPAADRWTKKISSKKTSSKNTTPSPLPPVAGPTVPSSPGEGGGGMAAPEEQQRAAVFVDALPYRGRLPGRKTREHLAARVTAAFQAGWSEDTLRRQLTEGTEGAKSLAAVYRFRLGTEELPDAPARVPRPAWLGDRVPPRGQGVPPNEELRRARAQLRDRV